MVVVVGRRVGEGRRSRRRILSRDAGVRGRLLSMVEVMGVGGRGRGRGRRLVGLREGT